jgi:hypothetical protein
MKKLLICAAVAGALVGALACSSHDDDHDHSADGGGGHTSPYPSCQRIIDACHELDVGAGPVHDCHDLAHDAKSEADCTPKEASCLATCKAAGQDSGATEGGSDAGGG